MLLEKPIVPLNDRDEVIVNATKLFDFSMQFSVFLRAHQLETQGADDWEFTERRGGRGLRDGE